ncbi:MAG TPA: DUF3857 and transglutaminase domain-containing protein [Flavisolibacter sp.]|jgi:transglutaminase-like putative cysteine protease|nr:DUF3857 and transglutaminase domain-containing protein [Flavisolibacter sp.]
MNRLFILCIVYFIIPITGSSQSVPIASEPSWISHPVIDYKATQLDEEAEDGYVDLDYERQVSLSETTTYYKIALKVLSDAGVQNSSEVSVNYDPDYEKLFFHTIRIIRDGQSINKLQANRFRIIQEEKDKDEHLYDGSLTALLLLEDVRKGDIIEYSYSLKGFNPIYQNKFTALFTASFSVPVYHTTYKLMVPEGRKMYLSSKGAVPQPVILAANGQRSYEWTLSNLKGLKMEERTPEWYDPYATIRASEYASWNEVKNWANALFPFDFKRSALFQSKVQEIRARNTTLEEQVGAALRFVQDEIRYLGIEKGVSAYKPHDPNQVLRQRFGDCKDKSYLLCALLQDLGVTAYPVLINTYAGTTLTNWLPSPNTFDHCTVKAVLYSRAYWFDPTLSYQRGPLKTLYYPDYKTGIVLKDSSVGLTLIPRTDPGEVLIKSNFNVRDMTGLAELVIKTTNRGYYADNARSNFQTTSKTEMLKSYKEYLTGYFDHIDADSIAYTEQENGSFVTTEYYTITDFWKAKEGVKSVFFFPFTIDASLRKPKDSRRTMPFSLSYPAKYKEEILISLPEDWGSTTYEDTIRDSAFVFSYNESGFGSKISLLYEYENLSDHVDPDHLKDYLANYNKINENAGYELTYGKPTSSSSPFSSKTHRSGNSFSLLYSLLILSVFITVLIKRYRKSSRG